MPDQIHPETLRALRERCNLTQEQLAEKCKCTKDTVSRWERGKNLHIRSRLKEPLASALGVPWENLTRPPKGEETSSGEIYPRVQLNVRVRPDARNALHLVCKRYNIRPIEVLEYAPLLFLVVAERSLQTRKIALEEIEARIASTSSANNEQAPHLMFYEGDDTYEELDLEEESIKKRDIHRRDSGAYDVDDFDPFVNYLRKLAKDLPSESVQTIAPKYFGAPDYEIALDTLNDALDLDPSSDQDDKIRDGVLEGAIDFREAVSKKSELSATDYFAWIETALTAAEAHMNRSFRDLMDAIEIGVIGKENVIELLEGDQEGDR